MALITDTIMMVRPANFGYNIETAKNNSFQSNQRSESSSEIRDKAIQEFDAMVEKLRMHEVDVLVVEDTDLPIKPDAIFPNNWISCHQNGKIVTYPMYASNRRIERREDIVDKLMEEYDFSKRYSLEDFESKDQFLEGTGSMILDRDKKIVYACLSERTDIQLLDKYCVLMGYQKVTFSSVDREGKPVYHTNVMMALGEDFCVLVSDSIADETELDTLKKSLTENGKFIVDLSYDQMEQFAGNMLQVKGKDGKKHLVMSKRAYQSLSEEQILQLSKFTGILDIDIDTIEYYGGGSVRCMMAEIFTPK